jgi:transcriptional regulator with XRE-family HTH domain
VRPPVAWRGLKTWKRGGWSGSDGFDRLIGHRLKQERRLAGKTREELGSALGIGAETIRAYEGGEMRLPPDRLAAATMALGVPMSLLFYPDQDLPNDEAEEETESRQRLAVRRPASVLGRPGYSKILPIVALWQEKHGQLCDDVHRTILGCGMLHRTVLVRQSSASSRLITEHLGMHIKIYRPCESLAAVGQDFEEHHSDREHAVWVAKAYAETLWDGDLRVESVRTFIRASAMSTLGIRYDRVLIPWRSSRGTDLIAMALSLQREAPATM